MEKPMDNPLLPGAVRADQPHDPGVACDPLTVPQLLLFFLFLSLLEPLSSHIASSFQVFSSFVGDPLHYTYVKLNIIKTALSHGEFPLWSPYEGFGNPLFSSGALPVLEALALLPHMSTVNFMWIMCSAYSFLSLVLFYRFAREVGSGQLGTVVACIYFTFSSYNISYRNDLVFLASAVLQTMLMLIILFASRSRNKNTYISLASAVIGMNLTYCRPNDYIWVLILAFFFSIHCAVRSSGLGLKDAAVKILVFWSSSVAIGLLLSAAVTLPFMENLTHSFRLGGAIQKTLYRVSFWDIVNPAGTVRYLVLPLPVLFAVAAASWRPFRRPRNAHTLFFLAAGLFMACLLLPTGLFDVIRALPLFANYAETIRVIPCLLFCVATLAGLGLSGLERGLAARATRLVPAWLTPRWMTGLSVVSLATFAAYLVACHTGSSLWKPLVVALNCIALLCLLVCCTRPVGGRNVVVVATVVFAATLSTFIGSGDLQRSNGYKVHAADYARDKGTIDFLLDKLKHDTFRVVTSSPSDLGRYFSAYGIHNLSYYCITTSADVSLFFKNALGVDAGVTTEYFKALQYPLYALSNAKYIVDLDGNPKHSAFENLDPSRYPVVYSDPAGGMVVREDLNVLPRVYMTCRYAVADKSAGPHQLQQVIGAQDDLLRRMVILDRKPDYASCDNTLEYKADIVAYRNNMVTVAVEANAPATLTLLDHNDGNWKATVDGKDASVFTSNMIFRAINVEAGRHEVVFMYRPSAFFIGCSLSFLGLVIAFALLWRDRIVSRRHCSGTP